MTKRTRGSVGAGPLSLHSIRRVVGYGFWRRSRVIQHRPLWQTLAWSRDARLETCAGDRECIETRVVPMEGFARGEVA
jgi:hypothetical protein